MLETQKPDQPEAKKDAMQILDAMGDDDPEGYSALRQALLAHAEAWCQTQFHPGWTRVRELGDFPVIYTDTCHGYRAIVATATHPEGIAVEILLTPAGIQEVRLCNL